MEAMEGTGHASARSSRSLPRDLDRDSVIAAGKGQYGENIIEDVSAVRLSRFFTKKNSSYIVSHEISAKWSIFAPQNVFQDPPFGKLDLISCRNMMIYFQNSLQKDLFAIFHLALNDGGYLFLGRSEAISGCGDIYTPLCQNEKIFIHNASGHAPKDMNIRYHVPPIDGDFVAPQPHAESSAQEEDSAEVLRLEVLEKFMPPCLLIDEQNLIRHVFGDCNNYLHVPAGKGELNIFLMLADDLRIAVSTALKRRAMRTAASPTRMSRSAAWWTAPASPSSCPRSAGTTTATRPILQSCFSKMAGRRNRKAAKSMKSTKPLQGASAIWKTIWRSPR
jgi:two-component system CheB/CheR fusion protein